MLRILVAVVGTAIGLLLGWLVVRQVEWDQVGQELLEYPPAFFVAGLAVTLASTYVRAFRWRLLYQDPRARTLRLFLIENAALGLNNVSPLRVVAEPVQVGLLSLRDKLSPGEILGTLGVTRVLDLLITVAALSTSLMLLPVLRPFLPLLVGATLASVLTIGLLFAVALGSSRIPMINRLLIARDMRETIAALKGQPDRVGASLGTTAVQWGLVCLASWVISQGTDYQMNIVAASAVILGAVFFATSVPGLPVAVGTFEFAIVELMAVLGTDAETAVTFGLLMRVVFFVPQMVFAAVVLPREGVGSLAAMRGLFTRWSKR